MKEKWMKFKRKADKITAYLWDVDSGFIMMYLGIVITICIIIELVGGDCTSFALIIVGTLLGKVIGYRLRVRKELEKEFKIIKFIKSKLKSE